MPRISNNTNRPPNLVISGPATNSDVPAIAGPVITAPVNISPSTRLQRSNFPFCGRLIVLQAGGTKGFDPFEGVQSFTSINFPSMPDSIELSRAVDYFVSASYAAPDGIHSYKQTNPLTLPFSFKLHAFDKEYCPRGSRSLLELAGLLHSFALPIAGFNAQNVTVSWKDGQASTDVNSPVSKTKSNEQNNDVAGKLNRANTLTTDNPSAALPPNTMLQAPVTLRLELIYIDRNSPGIVCTGYVKDVRVRLNGPWLRGPGISANLPTSGDYEFTFVHAPGYGNSVNLRSTTARADERQAQAFADDVKNRLYNTIDLTSASTAKFAGLNS